MRNASHTRDFKSYAELERAANAHLQAIAEQIELKGQLLERTRYWEGRASKLDLLRQIAADQVEIEAADFYRDASITALSKDIEITRLKRLLQEERAKLEAPQAAPATREQQTAFGDLQKLFAEMKEIEKAFDEYIRDIVEEAGGEEHLSEEASQHVENIRLLKADKIQTIYERAR